MDKGQEATADQVATARQIGAAAAVVIGVFRDLAESGMDCEETCGQCGCSTSWSQAMYDLLASHWVCPSCWDNEVE